MSQDLKTILCIDDEEDILEVVKVSLETVGGFQVTCCKDSVRAAEVAQKIKPDIILLDVMMPEKDGPAVLREMQQISELDDVPVIFLTARVQRSEIDEYLDMGAVATLAKPFDPMDLAAQITRIWKHIKSGK